MSTTLLTKEPPTAKELFFWGSWPTSSGKKKYTKTLQTYYDEWKFKHPLPNDFRRIAERVSGLQLQWYLTDWTQTTNTIDYAIESVSGDEKTTINLKRKA